MFDRCDAEARRIVDIAIRSARELGHGYVGTEHLLLALCERRQVLPRRAMAWLPETGAVRAAMASLTVGPRRRDSELLRSIGVDLEQVRAAVRRTFGDQAIDELGRQQRHHPWQPWRRPSRRCTSVLAGGMTVTPRAKEAFERAWRDAKRRGVGLIDPALLLLGVVEVDEGVANRLLRDLGTDREDIRESLRDAP